MFCSVSILLVLSVTSVICVPELILHTSKGALEGGYFKTRHGKERVFYASVPYAEPPVGELRFKAPHDIAPWAGVRNATIDSPECIQRNPYTRETHIHGQEDCLYLNIYTPYKADQTAPLLPVMVFIHGGGWMCLSGNKNTFAPDYILDEDVILVVPNYRLGPLGFLSTGDEACPGNNGLKDQRQVLRWIQNEIHHFGGDKDSVTIFGESAGGASVHYHMISPSSKGLFHKAISMSGTAFDVWANSPPGEAVDHAHKLGELLKCSLDNTDEMIACLRKVPANDIIDTEYNFYDWDYEPMIPFKPVVEPQSDDAFLWEDPRHAPLTSDVPWITGLTKDDGALKSVPILSNATLLEQFVQDFRTIAPITFMYHNAYDIEETTDAICEFYTGDEQNCINEQSHQEITDMYTDAYFAQGAHEAIRILHEELHQPIYLYLLSYRAGNSYSQKFGDPDGDYGVCHADDLLHLFPEPSLNKPKKEHDEKMIDIFVNYFTNFAKSGNPNAPSQVQDVVLPEWTAITNSDAAEYLDIDQEVHMAEDYMPRAKFWDTLPLWHNEAHNEHLRDEL